MDPQPRLCRDCFETGAGPEDRCRRCGSPRLVVHPELDALSIAHVDCDAFYAAVEKRDTPSLRDKPVVVGGSSRGVVLTACYIARTFGIRSAMPMARALRACPQAVVVRPDMAKYAAVGRQVRAMMLELTPLVEPVSIDEAFLDLTGTDRVHSASPAAMLARFAARVEAEIGIQVSIGLSYCKFLAKVASEDDKPRGYAVIGRVDAVAFLATRSVGALWGVGRVAQQRLARQGITTIGDLQALGEDALVQRCGNEGTRLWRLANGIDARPVKPQRSPKSMSAETTFDADVADPEALARTLYRLCERVAARLKQNELAGASITLKLKTAEFRIFTVARSGLPPTQLTGRIFAAARPLLIAAADGRRFRLIGVGVGDLGPAEDADRGDLVDVGVGREKATEAAVDRLRARFGAGAITRGIVFEDQRRKR